MKTARMRIIKHEAVAGCGSFEVRFADGREFFFGRSGFVRHLFPGRACSASNRPTLNSKPAIYEVGNAERGIYKFGNSN
jgi:hypothetical protein